MSEDSPIFSIIESSNVLGSDGASCFQMTCEVWDTALVTVQLLRSLGLLGGAGMTRGFSWGTPQGLLTSAPVQNGVTARPMVDSSMVC